MASEASNVSNSRDRFLIYGAQGVGCIAGILGIAMGVYNCVTFKANCFIAGIIVGIFGFFMVVFEAPYCCLMFECTDKMYTFSQRFSPLIKAVAYVICAMIPLILCVTSISLWIACGVMACCGILYGVKALQRTRDSSGGSANAAAAQGDTESNDGSRTNLVAKK